MSPLCETWKTTIRMMKQRYLLCVLIDLLSCQDSASYVTLLRGAQCRLCCGRYRRQATTSGWQPPSAYPPPDGRSHSCPPGPAPARPPSCPSWRRSSVRGGYGMTSVAFPPATTPQHLQLEGLGGPCFHPGASESIGQMLVTCGTVQPTPRPHPRPVMVMV